MNINPEQLVPNWQHTITLRGREWPLLPPEQVDADDAPPRGGKLGLIHLPGMACAALKRILVGATIESQLRRSIASVFPAEAHAFVAQLTTHELIYCQQTYLALQADHFAAINRKVVEALMAEKGPATSDQRSGEARNATPVPGGRSPVPLKIPVTIGTIPDQLRPLFADNRRKGPATSDQASVEGAQA